MKNLVKLAKRYREDIMAIEVLVLILLLTILSAILSPTHPILAFGMFSGIILAVNGLCDIELE